jgi:hypothetical protein
VNELEEPFAVKFVHLNRYRHGDRVYYKRDGQDKWIGPGKVIFQDGRVVFVRHGGVFVRVSPNRLIKAGHEFSEESIENGALADQVNDSMNNAPCSCR